MDGVREFVLLGVRFSDKTGCPVMLLKERENGRVFGIFISKLSVHSALVASDVKRRPESAARPLSYEFALALAEAGGLRIERVVIDRLTEEGVFTAAVEVRSPEGEVARLDARPSDAIPLALAAAAPVVVADEVLANVTFHALGELPYREIEPEDLA